MWHFMEVPCLDMLPTTLAWAATHLQAAQVNLLVSSEAHSVCHIPALWRVQEREGLCVSTCAVAGMHCWDMPPEECAHLLAVQGR